MMIRNTSVIGEQGIRLVWQCVIFPQNGNDYRGYQTSENRWLHNERKVAMTKASGEWQNFVCGERLRAHNLLGGLGRDLIRMVCGRGCCGSLYT